MTISNDNVEQPELVVNFTDLSKLTGVPEEVLLQRMADILFIREEDTHVILVEVKNDHS